MIWIWIGIAVLIIWDMILWICLLKEGDNDA